MRTQISIKYKSKFKASRYIYLLFIFACIFFLPFFSIFQVIPFYFGNLETVSKKAGKFRHRTDYPPTEEAKPKTNSTLPYWGYPLISYRVDLPYFPPQDNAELLTLHNMGLKCLKESDSPYGYIDVPFEADYNKRIQEFERLKGATQKYRGMPTYCWEEYCGMHTEDMWIDQFLNENLSMFGPFIPVFVPWLNFWKNFGEKRYQNFIKDVFALLKPNFLYITVVDSDFGIEGTKDLLPPDKKLPPNLLIITPAGRGHVPIPLLKSIQPVMDLKPVKYETSFIGYQHYPNRVQARNFFKEKLGERYYDSNREKDWNIVNSQTKAVLSPRGNARGCFRTYELLQQGFVQILLFDDYMWLPYNTTDFPWEEMAIIGFNKDLEQIYQKLIAMNESDRERMRKKMLEYKHYFTYEGTMEQIAWFMHGQGFMRCTKYYETINPFPNKQ